MIETIAAIVLCCLLSALAYSVGHSRGVRKANRIWKEALSKKRSKNPK